MADEDDVQRDLAFMEFHARNAAEALALRGRQALIVGCGAVGSNVAALLARSGMDISILDRDHLETANLHRHVASRRFVGEPKALATAKTLRSELPGAQTIRGIHGDAELLTDEELVALVAEAAVVVGATGSDVFDRRLNAACRTAGVPLVVPGMWPEGGAALGEVLVVAWGRQGPGDRLGACFACVSPDRGAAAAGQLEAQAGESAEVVEAASMTVQLAIGLLLPDSDRGRWITQQLRRGRNYFLIRRLPTQLVSIATTPRPGCPGCGAEDTGQRAGEQRRAIASESFPTRQIERLPQLARIGLALVAGVLLPWALIGFGLDYHAAPAVMSGVMLGLVSLITAIRTRLWSRVHDAAPLEQWIAGGVLAVGIVTVVVIAAIVAVMVAILALFAAIFRVFARSSE